MFFGHYKTAPYKITCARSTSETLAQCPGWGRAAGLISQSSMWRYIKVREPISAQFRLVLTHT